MGWGRGGGGGGVGVGCRNRYKGKETQRNYALCHLAPSLSLLATKSAHRLWPVRKEKKKKEKKKGEKCTCCSGKVAMETGDKYNKGNYALFAGKGRRVRSIVHIARAVVDRVRQMCVNHWQPR